MASKGTVIGDYLASIGKISVLSKSAQIFHSKRIKEWIEWPGGREKAPKNVARAGNISRRRMIESNLRMVVSMAKNYANQGVPLEDLIQEGNIGLMTACEKFDPERGYCFSTFSYWWIKQAMIRCLANQSRCIRVPCSMGEMSRKVKQAIEEYKTKHGKQPTKQEISKLTGIRPESVALAIQSSAIQPVSFDQIANDCSSSLINILAAKDTMEDIESEQMLERLNGMIEELPDLERMVVIGVALQGMTFQGVGQTYGMSSVRAGRVYRDAVARLQSIAQIEELGAALMNECSGPEAGLTNGRAARKVSSLASHKRPPQSTSSIRYENVLAS